jgi:hypothetical protein
MFDSDDDHSECLERARERLSQILNCDPDGIEYDGFNVQVDIAKMKEKKKLIHLSSFDPKDVFPHITSLNDDEKREYKVGDQTYMVRMNSSRYHIFKENPRCVCCNMLGDKMILDLNPGDHSPHFNLYAEESGRLVLMTKDHILPKSRGGKDTLENYQTMCCTCNNLKGAYDLEMEDLRALKELWGNPDKLPRKELRNLINNTRNEMAARFKERRKEKDERCVDGGEGENPTLKEKSS